VGALLAVIGHGLLCEAFVAVECLFGGVGSGGVVVLCWNVVLAGITAHAEHHAEVDAGDERGGAAAADEGQGLAGDGYEAYGHEHVDHGLDDEQECQPHGEEGRKTALAPAGYAAGPEEEDDVEKEYEQGAENAHLLNDDGVDEVGESLRQVVALVGVAGHLAYDVAGGDGYVGVGLLGVFLQEEGVVGGFLGVGGDARLPGLHAVEESYFVDGFLWKDGDQQDKEGYDGGEEGYEPPQLLHGHAAYEHHDEYGGEEDGGCGEVFRHYEGAHDAGYCEDELESPPVGAFLALHVGEDEGHRNDDDSLGQFGWLEAYAEVEPARAAVFGRTEKERDEQQDDAQRKEEKRDDFEVAARDGMEKPCDAGAQAQKQELLEERGHEVAALVGEGAGGTEHFDEGNHAEQEKYHPNDGVALKNTAGGYVHFLHAVLLVLRKMRESGGFNGLAGACRLPVS